MAEIFVAEGCRVDVVERNDPRVVPQLAYDVVVDIHRNLERWSPHLSASCLKVLHVTGAHWLTQNVAEMERLLALRERRGLSLQPRRQAPPVAAIEAADCATVLGNAFTLESFAFARKPLHRIPISSAYEFDWVNEKNWGAARKKFLWLGSFGMVHKGLDLVLEAFAGMPDLELTVCGRPEKEADFFGLYERELTGFANIHHAGWVDPDSEIFTHIRETHGAVVYPSCSEGGGGAVIHCLHAGMLPVVTRAASVDIGSFGVDIGAGTVEAVRNAVRLVSELAPHELEARSRAAWEHAREHHTRHHFRENYRAFVRDLLSGMGREKK